jgi:hypothetical protein
MLFISLILSSIISSPAYAKSGDVICTFNYTSPANPESFQRTFAVGTEESLLIGQRAVKVKISKPKDLSLLNRYSTLELSIWDDAGAVGIDQQEFIASGVMINGKTPVQFKLNLKAPEKAEIKESYIMSCLRSSL